jgi:hypothetical protein
MRKERMGLMDPTGSDLASPQEADSRIQGPLDRWADLKYMDERLAGRTVDRVGSSARLMLRARAMPVRTEEAVVQQGKARLDHSLGATVAAFDGAFIIQRVRSGPEASQCVQMVEADARPAGAPRQMPVLRTHGGSSDIDRSLGVRTVPDGSGWALSPQSENIQLEPRLAGALAQGPDRRGQVRPVGRMPIVTALLDRRRTSTRTERAGKSMDMSQVTDLPVWGSQ